MSRSRKKTNANKAMYQGFESLIIVAYFLITTILKLIYRIIVLIYDVISFHTSEYKIKSGNSFFKTYFDKGFYGEFILYRKVCRILGKTFVLTNLYLENTHTDTTEIDVLAISNKCIYVFEMKNYGGYIYGSQNDTYWTQAFNKRTKNQFYNPLRQNYAHVKAVEKYLEISGDIMTPMVVFSNRSFLSHINVEKTNHVHQFGRTLKIIKHIEKKSENKITDQEKSNFYTKLLERCHMPEDVKLKHIEQVKEIQTHGLK